MWLELGPGTMGHSSKKKKKRGGGGRRAASKDYSDAFEDDQDLLTEEMTALAAIFQDDLEIMSEPSCTQCSIRLRPYSNDMGFEDLHLSARLIVRCLPGYPHKAPKLQVLPDKGLSNEDAERLLSLLSDQANSNAREGRVMVFNLVEAAQEFLSEISPEEPVLTVELDRKNHLLSSETAKLGINCCCNGDFVYSSIDLFGDLCGDDVTLGGHASKFADNSSSKASSDLVDMSRSKSIFLKSYPFASNENAFAEQKAKKNESLVALNATKTILQTVMKLDAVAEEKENLSTTSNSKSFDQLSLSDKSEKSSNAMHDEDDYLQTYDGYDSEGEYMSPSSFVSSKLDEESHSKRKDLLLVHLLHLACSSNQSFSSALPDFSRELHDLGIISEWARDLACAAPTDFKRTFQHVFEQQMTSSQNSDFWKLDNFNEDTSSKSNSRYMNDFEEIRSLGRGGFGHVTLCKNKLDGRQYAVKKIRLKDRNLHVNEKILRQSKKAYLLIDFSDYLQINVYVLGAVFLQLCKTLYLSEHPFIQKLVDPSLFIHRFTQSLLGSKNPAVCETALRIISRMKLDWIQTGRKPGGICGAALYIAALSHGLGFSKSDIVTVVHVCETTLTKRLIEFENTESGCLTIEEFLERADEVTAESLASQLPKPGEVLCKHKDKGASHFAHGLCKKCYSKFVKISGGLQGGAEPPAFQRAEKQRMMKANQEKKMTEGNLDGQPSDKDIPSINGKQCSSSVKGVHVQGVPEFSTSPEHKANHLSDENEEDEASDDGPENFSDIDDVEVDSYIHNEKEKELKRIIWEEMNREYVEEQAAKEAAAAAAKEAYEASLANGSADLIASKELVAAAAAAVSKSRKEKRRAKEARDSTPAQTPLEATCQMLKQKGLSSKVNYDALKALYSSDDDNPKKQKTDTDKDDHDVHKGKDNQAGVDDAYTTEAFKGDSYADGDYDAFDYGHDQNRDEDYDWDFS